MRVLQIISSVAVGLGGVLESVRMLSEDWTKSGHQVEVATLDPPGFADALAFPVRVHTLGPSRTKYAYSSAFYPWLREHHHEYDIVLVHGLWQYHTFASWRALHGQATPYTAFTHGMLDPYFKRRFPLKHLKKWLFWPWSEYRLLRDAKAVMFTCEEEKVLARQSFFLYKAHELVVGLGTKQSPFPLPAAREAFLNRFPQLREKRLLIFMGRLHPKKACDLLLEAFSSTLAADPSWQLVMAGPDLDGWGPTLQQLASQLQIQDRVTWTGMLQGELKWGALAASEVFALPSHQENFGIVVAEALACGLPVLLSDQVNIWREVESSQAGFVTTDTRSGVEKALTLWSRLSETERLEMRSRCLPCFQRYFDIHTVSASLMQTLEGIVDASRTMPQSV
ncbi:MAG TPA: glycosyltransferase [Acidisarcina sp.]|nr:glycosyltransferase [Acidisarcina sp.]